MMNPKPGDMVRYEKGGPWWTVTKTWVGPTDCLFHDINTRHYSIRAWQKNSSIIQLRPAEETLGPLLEWFRSIGPLARMEYGCYWADDDDRFEWRWTAIYAVEGKSYLTASAKSRRLALLRLKRKVEGK